MGHHRLEQLTDDGCCRRGGDSGKTWLHGRHAQSPGRRFVASAGLLDHGVVSVGAAVGDRCARAPSDVTSHHRLADVAVDLGLANARQRRVRLVAAYRSAGSLPPAGAAVILRFRRWLAR